MKKIEKLCGFIVMDDNNNIIGYEAANSGEGMIFKDDIEGNNIVYIPESAEWDKNWFMPANMATLKYGAYTFQDIVDSALDIFEEYNLTNEQGKFLANAVHTNADWELPETYLYESDIEDIILSEDIFTTEQKRMCMQNMIK